jgi:hypothetical protein
MTRPAVDHDDIDHDDIDREPAVVAAAGLPRSALGRHRVALVGVAGP